jgi:L-iditol 2-dehydrogenase
MKQALSSVGRGGTILMYAPTTPGVELPVRVDELWKNGVRIVTSYAAAKEDLEEAMGLIAGGKVDVRGMITHRLPIEKTGEGFRLVAGGRESIKVIIRPHG